MTMLRPFTDAEFARWRSVAVPAYAASKVQSGAWDEASALALAEQETNTLLPAGKDTPDHFMCSIVDDDGVAVGTLWFAIQPRAGTRVAYVYDIAIDPPQRRKGHAARALGALEGEVRRMGLSGIALHVFGHNHAAQALYARLGYQPTNINLFKPVDAATD
jgi:ribosomal protein S18 acetylase RimI-like enzyme